MLTIIFLIFFLGGGADPRISGIHRKSPVHSCVPGYISFLSYKSVENATPLSFLEIMTDWPTNQQTDMRVHVKSLSKAKPFVLCRCIKYSLKYAIDIVCLQYCFYYKLLIICNALAGGSCLATPFLQINGEVL